MDRVLRAALRPGAGAGVPEALPASCPDPEALAALVEGSLARAERELVEAHCASCTRCQETLASLVRALPVAAGTDASAPAWGWLRWRPWRWAVPATAMAALIAAWVATRAPRSGDQKAESIVAQSLPTRAEPEEVHRRTAAEPPALREETPSVSRGAAAPAAAGPAAGGDKSPASAGAPAGPARLESDAWAKQGAEMPAAAAPATSELEAMRVKEQPAPPPAPLQQVPAAPAELAEGRAAKTAPPSIASLGEVTGAAPAAPPAAAPAKKPDKLADRTEAKAEDQAKAGAVRGDEVAAAKVAAPAPVSNRPQETGMRALAPAASEARAPGGSTRWRFAFGGLLFKSSDAGLSWDRQESGVTADLLAGAAPSPTVCWIVGKGGTVIVTADGERWQARPLAESVDVARVEARDALTAVVTAVDGRRFSTVDGGATWTELR
jgi:hypothetical protein